MKTDSQEFLGRLVGFPANTFEGKFLKLSLRLGLGSFMAAGELRLLFRAGFLAGLCNLAFNRCKNGAAEIEPEQKRVILERRFMEARDQLRNSEAWVAMPQLQRDELEKLLEVRVADENLAW